MDKELEDVTGPSHTNTLFHEYSEQGQTTCAMMDDTGISGDIEEDTNLDYVIYDEQLNIGADISFDNEQDVVDKFVPSDYSILETDNTSIQVCPESKLRDNYNEWPLSGIMKCNQAVFNHMKGDKSIPIRSVSRWDRWKEQQTLVNADTKPETIPYFNELCKQPLDTIDNVLAYFVQTCEYVPKTLTNTLFGLQRYMTAFATLFNKKQVELRNKQQLPKYCAAVKNRESKESALNQWDALKNRASRNSAEIPVFSEQEERLWSNGLLGKEGESLITTVMYYIIKIFGINIADSLKKLTRNSFVFGENEFGQYVELLAGDCTDNVLNFVLYSNYNQALFVKDRFRHYRNENNPRSFYNILHCYLNKHEAEVPDRNSALFLNSRKGKLDASSPLTAHQVGVKIRFIMQIAKFTNYGHYTIATLIRMMIRFLKSKGYNVKKKAPFTPEAQVKVSHLLDPPIGTLHSIELKEVTETSLGVVPQTTPSRQTVLTVVEQPFVEQPATTSTCKNPPEKSSEVVPKLTFFNKHYHKEQYNNKSKAESMQCPTKNTLKCNEGFSEHSSLVQDDENIEMVSEEQDEIDVAADNTSLVNMPIEEAREGKTEEKIQFYQDTLDTKTHESSFGNSSDNKRFANMPIVVASKGGKTYEIQFQNLDKGNPENYKNNLENVQFIRVDSRKEHATSCSTQIHTLAKDENGLIMIESASTKSKPKFYTLSIDEKGTHVVNKRNDLNASEMKVPKVKEFYTLSVDEKGTHVVNKLNDLNASEMKVPKVKEFYTLSVDEKGTHVLNKLNDLKASEMMVPKVNKFYTLSVDEKGTHVVNKLNDLNASEMKVPKVKEFYTLSKDEKGTQVVNKLNNLNASEMKVPKVKESSDKHASAEEAKDMEHVNDICRNEINTFSANDSRIAAINKRKATAYQNTSGIKVARNGANSMSVDEQSKHVVKKLNLTASETTILKLREKCDKQLKDTRQPVPISGISKPVPLSALSKPVPIISKPVCSSGISQPVPLNGISHNTRQPVPISLVQHGQPVPISLTPHDARQPVPISLTPHDARQPVPISLTPHDARQPVPISLTPHDARQPVPISLTPHDARQPVPISLTPHDARQSVPISLTPHDARQSVPISLTPHDVRQPVTIGLFKAHNDTQQTIPITKLKECELNSQAFDYVDHCNEDQNTVSSFGDPGVIETHVLVVKKEPIEESEHSNKMEHETANTRLGNIPSLIAKEEPEIEHETADTRLENITSTIVKEEPTEYSEEYENKNVQENSSSSVIGASLAEGNSASASKWKNTTEYQNTKFVTGANLNLKSEDNPLSKWAKHIKEKLQQLYAVHLNDDMHNVDVQYAFTNDFEQKTTRHTIVMKHDDTTVFSCLGHSKTGEVMSDFKMNIGDFLPENCIIRPSDISIMREIFPDGGNISMEFKLKVT